MNEQDKMYYEKRFAELEHRIYANAFNIEELEKVLQLMDKYKLQTINVGQLRIEARYQPQPAMGLGDHLR
jgi:hypothetical protein